MNNNFDDLVKDTSVADNKLHTTPKATPQMSTKDYIDSQTYTEEELRDVNNIIVTVPDTKTPIVVFFGSQASGKTLALLRMIRFFEKNECSVVPEAVFRPKSDKHYAKMCAGLKNMAYNNYAPHGNDIISFMLVKVLDKVGNPICQILEAPGEHYFDGTASLNFPTYISQIRSLQNRKVWVFFVEQDWGQNQNERDLYAQKICSMQSLISPKDKVVFLFNKVDKHLGQFRTNGQPNKEVFFTSIKNQYPNIFARYQNSGWFSRVLFGDYNFKAVCFSSGAFTDTADGKQVWIPGDDDTYCRELWNAIK